MKLAGYKQWIEVFDEDISKIWLSERKEFQKAAMLFGAFERELRCVKEKLERDLLEIKEKMEEKDSLTKNTNPLVCGVVDKQKVIYSKNKENLSPNISSIKQQNRSDMESPDLFKNNNNFPCTEAEVVDLSLSDEEKTTPDNPVYNIKTSPTIQNKNKKIPSLVNSYKKKKFDQNINDCTKNIFQTDLEHDMSVIDCTPETNRTKTDIVRTKINLTKKRSNNSHTLTQMFSKSIKRKMKPPDNKKKLEHVDSEETFYEDNSDEEPMHLTDLLNYINNDEQMETDYSEESSQTSNISNKKPRKETNLEPEPTVRGHARKQLTGFSCEKCRKFYGNMNLSPEELQKVINECSKHRFKYNMPDDTLPGFWDLSFKPPSD